MIITVWLVFQYAVAVNAAQTAVAIPFSSIAACEAQLSLAHESILSRRIEAEARGTRLIVQVEPHCTTDRPPFWIPFRGEL